MSNSIDEIVEEKIEEKLGLYDTSGRRTANEIRDLIQEELGKRPKTSHELKNAVHATKSTVENHCSHLENMGVVESFEKKQQSYWRLNK